MKTVAGVFSTMPDVDRVVRELERLGISSDDISVIAGNDDHRHREYLDKSKHASATAGAAAASGASFGGGVGIIASLVALAIPGVGPIVAGGAIATVLTGLGIGAASGGIIATLRNMGLPHEEAPLYEEAIRRGALIVAAKVDEPLEQEVVALMRENGARDLKDEADTWREQGWSGPHSDPHPYSADSTILGHEPPKS